MRSASLTALSSDDRRHGFFVHRIQKGYMAWIGFLLFLYSTLFFTVAFYGAHLNSMVALYGGGSLQERQAAAAEMLMLSESLWVAVPILFFGSLIFSLIITRRIAGPLYRLDESMQQWAGGNLSWRMAFRSSDRLDALGETANHALEHIEQSLACIEHQSHIIQRVLSHKEYAESAGLGEVRQASKDIEQVLRRFEFRPMGEPSAKAK